MQLLLRFIYPLFVLAVNDKYEPLCARIVVPPQRPNFVLTSNVPNIELYVLISDGLNVETDCEKFQAKIERDKENVHL